MGSVFPALRERAGRLTAVLLFGLLSGAAGCGPTGDGGLGAPIARADDGAADSSAKVAPPADEAATNPAARAAEPALEHPFPQRVKAPALAGGVAWLNAAGPIELSDLKGKFVVLDFWTYCCINCMHILPELKKLERAYPNEIVVIGVHSAKFDAEQDSKNIAEAVQRYDIEHPVVNDADHKIWDAYQVDSWPTLRIIDPEGNLVAGHSAEIEFATLDGFFKRGLPYYEQRKLLDRTPLRFDLEAQKAKQTPLRFPGKVSADEANGRLFIADSNHNRLVVAKLDGTLIDVIGSGAPGSSDGDFTAAQFNHPQGMALRGETLYVADTENHLLRKVDLKSKQVTTIAGVGRQARGPWPGMERLIAGETTELPARFVGAPLKTALNSPWDLCLAGNDLFIAMAGPHQIWKMPLDESEIGIYAGSGREDIIDGPLLPRQPYAAGYAAFAQPSGIVTDGERLYVADSEGSSIRAVPLDAAGRVTTIVGTAALPQARLFTFGDQDGRGPSVRLQHPLGLAYHDGLLYVADTYNNKIKTLDPKTGTVSTLAGSGQPGLRDDAPQFDEPAGLSYAAGKLYVADTNNQAIRVIDLAGGKVSTLTIVGLNVPTPGETPAQGGIKAASKLSFPHAAQVQLPPQDVKPRDGKIYLAVKLRLPQGWKMNPLAPLSYVIEGQSETGVIDRAALGKAMRVDKPEAEVELPLVVGEASGEDRAALREDAIKLSLGYYYCREGAEGLCKMGSVAWTIPLRFSATAASASVPLEFNVK